MTSTKTHILAALSLLMVASCTDQTDTSSLAPPDPNRPPTGAESFSLAADARVTETQPTRQINASRSYSLPELIAIAQQNNPSTRAAWMRAQQAAQAVGLVEATYLPQLNAQIIAGVQRSEEDAWRDPVGLLPDGTATLDAGEFAAVLSVQWLLFDFGVREAARASAKELSFAANAGFSGAHQKLIFDVTQAYYDLWAAGRREGVQRARLQSAQEIATAANAQLEQGIATEIDVAQAGQFAAQAKFDLSRAQSETAVASAALSARVGVSPRQRLSPAYPNNLRLPSRPAAVIDGLIQNALQRRPDLQMAFAQARASKAQVDAVEAEFRPKIVASANLGRTFGEASFDDDGFPGSVSGSDERNIASVFVGVNVPLWDGGAKERRRQMAQAQYGAALADAEGLRTLAESEIVNSYELLKSSLAANQAAGELISTAATGLDAARSYSDVGLATVSDVNAAQKLLYDARLSQVEAQHSALSAAAMLAFASGQMGGS